MAAEKKSARPPPPAHHSHHYESEQSLQPPGSKGASENKTKKKEEVGPEDDDGDDLVRNADQQVPRERPLGITLDPWSRSSLEALLDTVRSDGKGFASSRVASYRPLGTPDLKRDRSFLPKSYSLFRCRYNQHREDLDTDDLLVDSEPLVLPTRLKGCYWNGERWCGTPFLPRLASERNGFEFLHDKVKKSHKRLIACRMGRYFLASYNHLEAKPKVKSQSPFSSLSYRPTIPRLNLKAVNQDFEYSKQLANNAALVFAYRVEAKRIASARSAAITARQCSHHDDGRTNVQSCFTKGMTTERSCSSVPAKAVADASLRQLSNILDKETRFTAVQENLNRKLRQITKAIDSARPFSYTQQFTSLKNLSPSQKSWENRTTDSPRKVETFRLNLEAHKWYEELVAMMFAGCGYPSKAELDILAQVSNVLAGGAQFDAERYVDLLKQLERRGVDLNSFATRQVLSFMRQALRIPDEVLLDGFLRKCTVIPAFLATIDVPKNYSRLSSRLSPSPHR